MKAPFKILLAVALAAGAFLAGRWGAPGDSVRETKQAVKKVQYYACPMHPSYKSDKPADCPACGMRMEPVYTDSGGAETGRFLPPGTVRMDAAKQQLIGVRYATAEVTDGTETVRAVGRIAYDDQEVVVLADMLQHEAALVVVGQQAYVSVPFNPDHAFWAVVDYIYPRLDQVTRTLKVRLHAPETGFKLLVETFVDVDFRISGPRALTVPAEAVLNSGQRRSVFVDLGDGYLAPRQVDTGRRLGDRIEIRHGLKAGDRVVVSANFLVDSESQLKLVADGAHASYDKAEFDPVCGMEVDPAKASEKAEYRGVTYHFCSPDCKEKFLKSPQTYTRKATAFEPPPPVANMAPNSRRGEQWVAPAVDRAVPSPTAEGMIVMEDGSAGDGSTVPPVSPDALPSERGNAIRKDPVCGKEVAEKNAYRRTVLYRGVTFYFCSEDCYEEYMKNPEVYGQKALPTVMLQKPRDAKMYRLTAPPASEAPSKGTGKK